jgi:hypothetical protein
MSSYEDYEDELNRFLDNRQLDNQDLRRQERLEELAERLDLTVDEFEKFLDDFERNGRKVVGTRLPTRPETVEFGLDNPESKQQRVARIVDRALKKLGIAVGKEHGFSRKVFPVQNSLDWCVALSRESGSDGEASITWTAGLSDDDAVEQFKVEIQTALGLSKT